MPPDARKRMHGMMAVLVLLVVVVAVGGWMRVSKNNNEDAGVTNTVISANANEQVGDAVSLTINNGSATLTYGVKVEGEVVAINLLKQAGTDQGFAVGVKSYDFGDMVEEIGGVKNDQATKTYWSFKVNGVFSNEGASTAKVKAGDSVEWIYTNAAY